MPLRLGPGAFAIADKPEPREAQQQHRPSRRLRNCAAENEITRPVADNRQVYVRSEARPQIDYAVRDEIFRENLDAVDGGR
jgi:hypothetical protein